jgi:hypothetical protein
MILFNYCRGTEENHKKWVNPTQSILMSSSVYGRSTAYTAYSVCMHMYKLQHKHNKRYLSEKDE